DWRNGLVLSAPVLAGTIAGAALASVLDAKAIGWAVIVAVVAALVMLLANPKRFLRDAAPGGPRVVLTTAAVFVPIGLWAGFIVLDAGTYMLLGLVLVVGYDLIRANAIKSLFLVWISLASLLVFDVEGEMNWGVGLLLSGGSIGASWGGGLLGGMGQWLGVPPPRGGHPRGDRGVAAPVRHAASLASCPRRSADKAPGGVGAGSDGHDYVLTPGGRCIALFFTKAYAHVLRPGLARLHPGLPPDASDALAVAWRKPG